MVNIAFILKKSLVPFLFIYFLLTLNISYAELSITDIKGLDAIVEDNYKHLSLIQGAIWWNKKIIENLYKNGNRQHATIQLLRTLFYLQADLVTFDITTLNRNPAHYFKESTIGIILATLEPYIKSDSLSEEIKKELFISLKRNIKNDINFQELYHKAKQTKIKITADALKNSKDFANLFRLRKLNEKIRKLRDAQKRASKTEFAEVSKIVANKLEKQKELTEHYGSVNQLEKKPEIKKIFEQLHKEDFSKKNLNDLIHHIINAFDENLSKKNQYPPFTIQQIFLAFLWKILEVKDTLSLFIKSFKDHYQTDVEVFNQKAFQTYLTLPPYTRGDFEDLRKLFLPEITIENALKDYEGMIFFLFASTIWDNLLPPLVDSIGESSYKNVKFPNCVETAIRNIINIIMFNPNLFNFHLTLNEDLITKGTSFDKKFSNFYQKYSNPLKTQLLKVHNAWNKVVSERQGIIYKKPEENPICEIKTSVDNVMNIINYCMFDDALFFKNLSFEEKFDTLCSCAQQLKLTWESDRPFESHNLNNMVITFNHNSKPLFTLVFEPSHCYLRSLITTIKKYRINFSSLIGAFQTNPTNYQDFINNNKIITILLFNIEEAQVWFITLSKDPLLAPKVFSVLKAILSFLDFEDAFMLSKRIILNKREGLYDIVKEIIQRNITLYSLTFFKLILENHAQAFYPIIQNSFSALTKEDKQSTLSSIINFKVSELYPLIEKEFKNFSQSLIKDILKYVNNDLFVVLKKSYNPKNKRRLYTFFKLILKFDAKPFYQLLRNDISEITHEDQLKLITLIMQKKRVELYPLVQELQPTLPHAIQKKLKKIFTAIEQSNQLLTEQKNLKHIFRKLLKNSLSEVNNKEFLKKIELFKNVSESFRNRVPHSDKYFTTIEINMLKNAKKLWNNLIKKLMHIYENTLECEEKKQLISRNAKEQIKESLKFLKKAKKQEVEQIKTQIAFFKKSNLAVKD